MSLAYQTWDCEMCDPNVGHMEPLSIVEGRKRDHAPGGVQQDHRLKNVSNVINFFSFLTWTNFGQIYSVMRSLINLEEKFTEKIELRVCNFLFKVGAGIPNVFGIPMVALQSVFQWCSVLDKMMAILS